MRNFLVALLVVLALVVPCHAGQVSDLGNEVNFGEFVDIDELTAVKMNCLLLLTLTGQFEELLVFERYSYIALGFLWGSVLYICFMQKR